MEQEATGGAERRGTSTLAERLERLFSTMHPRHRGEYSTQEVVDGIAAQGGPTISAVYLWQLRKGHRTNPTKEHLEALARFFGVSPSYFFDEDVSDVDEQLELLALLRDRQVQSIAHRTAALSPASRRSVSELIEILRRAEGHPTPATTDEPTES